MGHRGWGVVGGASWVGCLGGGCLGGGEVWLGACGRLVVRSAVVAFRPAAPLCCGRATVQLLL